MKFSTVERPFVLISITACSAFAIVCLMIFFWYGAVMEPELLNPGPNPGRRIVEESLTEKVAIADLQKYNTKVDGYPLPNNEYQILVSEMERASSGSGYGIFMQSTKLKDMRFLKMGSQYFGW